MTVKPVIDRGQELATPEMQAIGFVDTKEQFDAVTDALKAAGYADSKIIVLQGEDGIEMLRRLQKTFNFGDGEDAIMAFPLRSYGRDITQLALESKIEQARCRSRVFQNPSAPIASATSGLG